MIIVCLKIIRLEKDFWKLVMNAMVGAYLQMFKFVVKIGVWIHVMEI